MDTDLAMQMVASRSAGTQNAIQTTMLKKAHEADMAVVDLVSQAALSPPPQGQGVKIDKLA